MKNLDSFEVKELSIEESSNIDGGGLWYAIGYAAGTVANAYDAAIEWAEDQQWGNYPY